ncbi:MAG: late competence development ComFB family protein [Oscillospiraceae bacterium]
MDVKNMMEIIVEQQMEKILRHYDCCKCDKCKEDIFAIALNNMPPKYVSTRMGSFYARLDALSFQVDADVYKAIVRGIEMVKNNPNHNDN